MQKLSGCLLQTALADPAKNTYHTVIVSGVVGVIDDHFRLITMIRQAMVAKPVPIRR
uniref:Uncharacterized protein n=1 Tax=uncultured gamma proteobacterium HF0500_32L01 TaxID=723574 RepID=E7C5Y7_9GAMM|nr:hypothetical protein [uncultured gamma proteobacterium HF0500_32L01]